MNPRTATPTSEKSKKRLLRELYHSKVLPAIARQCPIKKPDGDGYFPEDVAIAAWKEKFRALFHPGRSTEKFDEQGYAELIVQVEAYACSELGCEFRESGRGVH